MNRGSFAGAGLDDDVVAAANQLGDPSGGDGDAVFVVLDLGRDADAHDAPRVVFAVKIVKKLRTQRNINE
jgi:hypothetical protein